MNYSLVKTRRANRKNASTSSLRTRVTGLVALPMLAFSLSACETLSRQQQGEILGGVVGGVIGTQIGDGRGQTAAIILGSIAGSMIGRQIGQNMDNSDRFQTAQALNDSRTGQSTRWVNPDTGAIYSVTPTRSFDGGNGPCREFQLDATIGNSEQQDVYGTACLRADGSWMVQ